MKRYNVISFVIAAYLVVALLFVSACAIKSAVQRHQFLECSKNQGDAGCDSCYYKIYGYYINPYTGEREE